MGTQSTWGQPNMFHCRTLAIVCTCLFVFIPVKSYPGGAYRTAYLNNLLKNTNSDYEKREEPWTSFKFERRSNPYGLQRRSSEGDNENLDQDEDGWINTKPWSMPNYFSYFHTPKGVKGEKRASLSDLHRKWKMENTASPHFTS